MIDQVLVSPREVHERAMELWVNEGAPGDELPEGRHYRRALADLEWKALADWQAKQQAHPHNWYCKCGTFLPQKFYERVLDIWEERTGVNGKPRVVTPADWKWSLEQALEELAGIPEALSALRKEATQ